METSIQTNKYNFFIKNNSNTPKEHVYQALWDYIVFDEMSPMQMISEKTLCNLFGVSRTPIREALTLLIEDGLIFTIPQKGTYVKQISLERAYEANYVREMIEPSIGAKACMQCSAQDIDDLAKIIDLHYQYFKLEDYRHSLLYDIEFHKLLYCISGYERTWNLIHKLSTDMYRVRFLKLKEHFRYEQTSEEHKNILYSIIENDREKTKAILSKHIHGYPGDVTMLQSKYKEYFI